MRPLGGRPSTPAEHGPRYRLVRAGLVVTETCERRGRLASGTRDSFPSWTSPARSPSLPPIGQSASSWPRRSGSTGAAPGVPVRLRGWRRRLSAGWLPRLDLRPARARLARSLRARGSRGAPRRPRSPRRVMACPAPRGRRLPARARVAGDARHRLLRQPQRPAAAPARAGGHDSADGGLSRRPRALAAPLPGRRPALLRPEGEVRVGLPTTKEARCPSTSCSRH